MRVAIVGHRSWLAPHLEHELRSRGHEVEAVAKDDVPYEDMSRFWTVVLIAGRARPTSDDLIREESLVRELALVGRQPRRVVYVSSSAVDRWERGSRPLSAAGEAYILAKKRCEIVVCGRPAGVAKAQGFAIRLPPTFGPGQDIGSDMLVPSVIRARLCHGILELREPLLPFELVYVGDAARAVVDLVEDDDPLPVRSVRSDLHQPLRLAALMAPGVQTVLREGWSWHTVGRPEPGQRHLQEVHFSLREGDLHSTVSWYEQNISEALEASAERRHAALELAASFPLLPSGVIDI